MKDKAPLSLMELGIMVLVFAVTAALCLKAFALADTRSRSLLQQEEALLLAQSAAETVKHCDGDLAEAAALLEDSLLQAQQNGLQLVIAPEAAALSGFGKASVRVLDGAGQELVCLPAAWQEVKAHD